MNVKSELEELITEYMPNVSSDYIYAFHICTKYSLFHKLKRFNVYFKFLNSKNYYLIIEFIDGNNIRFTITKKTIDFLKDKIDVINQYLEDKRKN